MNYKKKVSFIIFVTAMFTISSPFWFASTGQASEKSNIDMPLENHDGKDFLSDTIFKEITISDYAVYAEENFMGKKRLKSYIEFKNNTEYNIELIYFSFDGYSADGTKLISSQHNTNDLGTMRANLSFPDNLASLHLRFEKYITDDGKEHLISNNETTLINFAFPDKDESVPSGNDTVNDNNIVSDSVENIASSDSITITHYSDFLIGGTTPAIKVTLLNNTKTAVSDVQARIKTDTGFEMDYNANLRLESGKEATHSGWGLANGVKSIELAVISYTTVDGEKYVLPQDKLNWLHVDLTNELPKP